MRIKLRTRTAGALPPFAFRLPTSVRDLVSRDGGQHQETAGGRIEPDGRLTGTYWLTQGEQNTPRALTAEEEEGLRRLAVVLRGRINRA
jgi:hypothetical protein